MQMEEIGIQQIENQAFSIYRAQFSDGRQHFIAETAFAEGEKVLLDHWNLHALRREIEELFPIMKLARRLS